MVEKWKEITFVEKFIVCILAVIVLVSIFAIGKSVKNGKSKINEGTVIDKSYSAPYTTITYIKSGDISIPQNIYHPASYCLTIQGVKNGETVEYWFECTAEEYQQYKIGDYYKK